MENVVNNYAFANRLDQFKVNFLDPQNKKVDDAWKIVSDIHYKWRDEAQKELGQKQMDSYRIIRDHYQKLYDDGLKLCTQHEQLVDALSKWYDLWYANISNNGRQETELMGMQADMLCEIFTEIYKALLPLKLDIKPPNGLNL